jgi:hypothetical protein
LLRRNGDSEGEVSISESSGKAEVAGDDGYRGEDGEDRDGDRGLGSRKDCGVDRDGLFLLLLVLGSWVGL